MTQQTKRPWYASGLHFECVGCGNCCAGPEEGYIWISKAEIAFLAKEMGLTADEVQSKFLRRIRARHTIKEDPKTKDCIFLTPGKDGCRGCAVYSVRPNQCRTWPFWTSNLCNPDAWNIAAMRCPGINRGRFYSFDEIEVLRTQTHK